MSPVIFKLHQIKIKVSMIGMPRQIIAEDCTNKQC